MSHEVPATGMSRSYEPVMLVSEPTVGPGVGNPPAAKPERTKSPPVKSNVET